MWNYTKREKIEKLKEERIAAEKIKFVDFYL